MKITASLLFLTLCLQGSLSAEDQKWTRMEPGVPIVPDHYVWKNRAEPTEKHQCVFFLKGKNQAQLENILQQVSDPQSNSYGKHLTKEQIDELTVDKVGTQAVLKYLGDIGATVINQNASAIEAEAPISTWESALNTVFYFVINNKQPKAPLLRAHEYSLPSNISEYVLFVGNTIQFPPTLRRGPVITGGSVRLEESPKEISK